MELCRVLDIIFASGQGWVGAGFGHVFLSVFGTSGYHFGGLGAAGEAFGHPGGLKWGPWVAKVTFTSIFDGILCPIWGPWTLIFGTF